MLKVTNPRQYLKKEHSALVYFDHGGNADKIYTFMRKQKSRFMCIYAVSQYFYTHTHTPGPQIT